MTSVAILPVPGVVCLTFLATKQRGSECVVEFCLLISVSLCFINLGKKRSFGDDDLEFDPFGSKQVLHFIPVRHLLEIASLTHKCFYWKWYYEKHIENFNKSKCILKKHLIEAHSTFFF